MAAPTCRSPKIKKPGKNTVETILDLAIGRFNIQNGLFEVESRTRTPFSARGEHLAAHFDYEMLGPRYRGMSQSSRWTCAGPISRPRRWA